MLTVTCLLPSVLYLPQYSTPVSLKRIRTIWNKVHFPFDLAHA